MKMIIHHSNSNPSIRRIIVLVVLASILALQGSIGATIQTKAKNEASIQAAIDKLPPEGGVVQIVAKRPIPVRKSIVIKRNNVILRGEGTTATWLVLDNEINAPVIIMGDDAAQPGTTCTNIHVRDLSIDGNRLNQSSEVNPSNPALRNNGISIRRVTDSSVERVSVASCRSGGLVVELVSRRIAIRNFESYDNHFDGLAGYETEDSIFTDLKLHNNLAAGLSFDLDFVRNIIHNCIILNSGSVGIFMRDTRDNIFSNLLIRDSAQHGAFLAQADSDVTTPASGNTFVGCVIADSGGAAFRVNDVSCIDNTLTASQLIGNVEGGVSEATGGLVTVTATITR